MEGKKQFKIPVVEIASEIDMALLVSRIKEGTRRITKQLGEEDPKIARIAIALVNLKYFNVLNNKLNEEFSRLTSESEVLIDLPDANTPEIKAQRKVVADKINKILEKQRELEHGIIDIKNSKTAVNLASKDQLAKANLLVQSIISEQELIYNPMLELN